MEGHMDERTNEWTNGQTNRDQNIDTSSPPKKQQQENNKSWCTKKIGSTIV